MAALEALPVAAEGAGSFGRYGGAVNELGNLAAAGDAASKSVRSIMNTGNRIGHDIGKTVFNISKGIKNTRKVFNPRHTGHHKDLGTPPPKSPVQNNPIETRKRAR